MGNKTRGDYWIFYHFFQGNPRIIEKLGLGGEEVRFSKTIHTDADNILRRCVTSENLSRLFEQDKFAVGIVRALGSIAGPVAIVEDPKSSKRYLLVDGCVKSRAAANSAPDCEAVPYNSGLIIPEMFWAWKNVPRTAPAVLYCTREYAAKSNLL